MNIVIIESASEASKCFPLMNVLRPRLNEEEFLKKFSRQGECGYHLMACVDDSGEYVALAGYRIVEFMAWGKVLYVDDLVTDPTKKRKGYGGALMDWLENEAKQNDCDELHLDTGYGRKEAHKLYLKKGLELVSHHMSKKLK